MHSRTTRANTGHSPRSSRFRLLQSSANMGSSSPTPKKTLISMVANVLLGFIIMGRSVLHDRFNTDHHITDSVFNRETFIGNVKKLRRAIVKYDLIISNFRASNDQEGYLLLIPGNPDEIAQRRKEQEACTAIARYWLDRWEIYHTNYMELSDPDYEAITKLLSLAKLIRRDPRNQMSRSGARIRRSSDSDEDISDAEGKGEEEKGEFYGTSEWKRTDTGYRL
ncbi:hypothetical protein K469DRAFT_797791 [Zopfia rhizophila CBS 207.26]|uniref:Uncharacterized protein n=1 Tax=Zopfia rhizophila CBS 207.26 TaxID=1314779 RepID=A0A6A6DNN3_9PEZI|nr:hypothetical protein K469DRAFT_797791 [Zopfia rhizophila CBS 207.26]